MALAHIAVSGFATEAILFSLLKHSGQWRVGGIEDMIHSINLLN